MRSIKSEETDHVMAPHMLLQQSRQRIITGHSQFVNKYDHRHWMVLEDRNVQAPSKTLIHIDFT